MKNAKIAIQLVCAAALAAVLPACTTTGSTSSTATTVSQMVVDLSKAGFTPYSAKTAAQKAHIQSLPTDKLTKVNRHGTYMWVYPDAANNQVYVGNTREYHAFRDARRAQTGQYSEEDMVTEFDTRGGVPVEIYDGFVPMNALD